MTLSFETRVNERMATHHGKDRIARQMYSEKSNAAVYETRSLEKRNPRDKCGRRTFCHEHVRY